MTEHILGHRLAGPDPSTARNKAIIKHVVAWDLAALGGDGTYPLVAVKKGDIVLHVDNMVTTTISGDGTTGGVIGDDGATNRFITTFTSAGSSVDPLYAYPADNTIDLVATGGNATVGAGILFVDVYRP